MLQLLFSVLYLWHGLLDRLFVVAQFHRYVGPRLAHQHPMMPPGNDAIQSQGNQNAQDHGEHMKQKLFFRMDRLVWGVDLHRLSLCR